MSLKRLKDETFENYKARRILDNKMIKEYLKGKPVMMTGKEYYKKMHERKSYWRKIYEN